MEWCLTFPAQPYIYLPKGGMSYVEVVILGDASSDRFIYVELVWTTNILCILRGRKCLNRCSKWHRQQRCTVEDNKTDDKEPKTWGWCWIKLSPLNAYRAHLHFSNKSYKRRTSILEWGRRNLVGAQGIVDKPEFNTYMKAPASYSNLVHNIAWVSRSCGSTWECWYAV